jgi:hypothetical protein
VIREWNVERLANADALEERMLGLQMHQALLVQDFLKLSLIVPRLLASRFALNSGDFMVWLAFSGVSRVVPLAFVRVVVVVALLVIFAIGEALILLILLVGTPCHHVMEFHGSSWAVASEVMVSVLREHSGSNG